MSKRYGMIVIFYGLFAVFITWPLILNLSQKFPAAYGSDTLTQMWSMWFMKYSLFDLRQNPLSHTDYIFYPLGFDNALFGNENFINVLISIPLQLLFPNNIALVYNLIILFTFVASALGAYVFVFYFLRDRLLSVLGGLIIGFSPYVIARSLGHLNIMTIEFVPLYFLFLLRIFQESSRLLRYSFFAGLFLFMIALSSWHYFALSLLGTALILGYFGGKFLRNREKVFLRQCKHLLWTMFGTGIIVFLWVLPFIKSFFSRQVNKPNIFEHIAFSADPISYFSPPPYSLLGKLLTIVHQQYEKLYTLFSGNYIESTTFLGYLEIALTILLVWNLRAIAHKNHKVPLQLFLFLGGGLWVLSLGPFLKMFNMLLGVALPWLAFAYLPVMSFVRDPVRMSIFVLLFLTPGILLCLRQFIDTNFRTLKDRFWRPVFMVCVGLLLILERISIPYPLADFHSSKFYEVLARDLEQYAILDLPYGLHDEYNYYQTIHHKKIGSGMIIHTAFNQGIIDQAQSNVLLQASSCGFMPYVTTTSLDALPGKALNLSLGKLREVNFRYIVLHKYLFNRTHHGVKITTCVALQESLVRELNKRIPVAYEDAEVQVFDLRNLTL